jgi:hypothetical protein
MQIKAENGPLSEIDSGSINISDRITLELVIADQQIIPVDVGSHGEVYR